MDQRPVIIPRLSIGAAAKIVEAVKAKGKAMNQVFDALVLADEEIRAGFAKMPETEVVASRAYLESLEAAHARIAELTGAMDAADARLRDASIRVWGEDCWGCDAPDHMAEAILGLRAAPGAVTLPEPTAADLEPLIDWDLEYNEIRKGSDTCARVAEWFRSRLRSASPDSDSVVVRDKKWERGIEQLIDGDNE
jgi:hypothetical protein